MKCKDAVQPLGACSLTRHYIFELPKASWSHVLQKHHPRNLFTVFVWHLHRSRRTRGAATNPRWSDRREAAQNFVHRKSGKRKDAITVWTQERVEENLPCVGSSAPVDVGEFFKGRWIMYDFFLNESWGFQSSAANGPSIVHTSCLRGTSLWVSLVANFHSLTR